MQACLGIDTGGTFTDFVLIDSDGVRIHKVLSTPDAPEHAILQGIRDLGREEAVARGDLVIVHGTTVATNAALEGKGARTVFITNQGLEDCLLIGRQTRPDIYDLCPTEPEPVLRQADMLGTPARLDARGRDIVSLTDRDLEALRQQVDQLDPEAVAISLLFGFLNDEHERRIAEALETPGRFVCRASDILPLAGEYERGMATWLNAWLGPRVQAYLSRLDAGTGQSPVAIMQSHGGTMDARAAGERAVNLLLSGPAGGLCAARALAPELGTDRLMTFDMGGTSTDVSLIEGDFRLTLEGHIGPWPVAVPMVDMHTIGAGGGSIARLDEAGMLHVGPESAGASPGPACYGRGGQQPTVTDANVVLGRLPASVALGGSLELDAPAAEQAMDRLAAGATLTREDCARGIVELANEHMAQALRVISIQKGYDPADFTLVSFGGAGGLHVCALARMLGMRRAVVPRNAGVLSAQGLARAPRQRELLRALPANVDSSIVEHWRGALSRQGRRALLAEGVVDEHIHTRCFVDLCYRGQSFQLDIPWQGDMTAAETAFHEAHERRYGYRLERTVDWVNVRVQLQARPAEVAIPELADGPQAEPVQHVPVRGCHEPVAVYRRDGLAPGQRLAGPALISETVATTWLAPGWSLEVSAAGHLLLTNGSE
jgi:N-methylhydantoinase A